MSLRKVAFVCLLVLAMNCLQARAVCARPAAQYTVQVETVSFEPAARAVANRLKARGYDAYFESIADANGTVLYKVRFGRFATHRQADAAAQAYRNHEKRSCFVVQTMLPGSISLRPVTAPPKAAPPADVSAGDQTAVRPKAVSDNVQASGKAREFFTVQIAAKTDRSVARSLADRLRQSGYPVSIVDPAPGAVKPFYRVRIGSYTSRALAEQAGRDYAAREGGDYLIVLSSGRSRPAAGKMRSETAESKSPAVKPVAAVAADYFYTVQVSVCQKRQTAENYADTLRAKGFKPYIATYETLDGKKLYRVRMGRFNERLEAAELAHAYEQQGGADFIIVRTADAAAPQKASLPAAGQPESVPDRIDRPEVVKAPARVTVPASKSGKAAQSGKLSGDSVAAEPVTFAVRHSVIEEPLADDQAGRSQTVTKVYAYTGSDNELNLTNAYAKIPAELLARVQYISIFPVRLISVSQTGNTCVLDVEGLRRLVTLSGIRLPDEKRAVVSAEIQELLSAEPLRLKYAPGDDRKELLTGTLYYRNGTDLQIELLKQGLAHVDEGTAAGSRQNDLRAAQQRAQDLKAGIWSKSIP